MVRTANCWKSSCQHQSTIRVTRKYQMSHPVGGPNLPGSLSLGEGFFMSSPEGVSPSPGGFYHHVVAAALLTPDAQEHPERALQTQRNITGSPPSITASQEFVVPR